jgi:hypothetical protein
VLQHHRTDQASGQAPEEDPLVAIADGVALTPLPGFAGSWPALYKTLCALVLSCGVQDVVESDGAGPPVRILLFSRLRPLLDSAREGGDEQRHAQNLLLSQLQPVSKLCKEGSTENGLSFRDEEGGLRTLRKLGHVVKAVLQWRSQRLLWSQASRTKPTAVDDTLSQKLELVFSKRLNNLVLCLYDDGDTANPRVTEPVYTSRPRQEDPSERRQLASKTPNQRTCSVSENPFKWQPLSHSNDARIVAVARPFGMMSRCSSTPPSVNMSSQTCEKARVRIHNPVCNEVACATEHKAHEATCQYSDLARKCCPAKRWTSSMPCGRAQAFPGRSSNRSARSPSWPARSHSCGKRDATPNGLCSVNDGVEGRSTSAPPRQRWADIVDDVDERSPSQDVDESWGCRGRRHTPQGRARSSTRSPRRTEAPYARCTSEPPQQRFICLFDDPFEPPPQEEFWPALARVDSIVGNDCHVLASACDHEAKAETVHEKACAVNLEIVPATMECGGGMRTGQTRARSLTRSSRSERAQHSRSSMTLAEDLCARCTSEPPHQRVLCVFDDPFEPPPQEEFWLESPSPATPLLWLHTQRQCVM